MGIKYKNQIVAALSKIVKINAEAVQAKSKIINDFHLESIDFVDFIFLLEKEVGVQLDISDLSIRFAEECGKSFSDLTIEDIDSYLRIKVND